MDRVRLARFASSATAARYSSSDERMALVPVTSCLVSIFSPDPQGHPLVRDAHFVEYGPIGPEPQPLVETPRGNLSVKIDPRESRFCGVVHEVAHDQAADPGAAALRQYCDTPDLTGGFEPSRADRVTVLREHEHVGRHRIDVVPFLRLGDALFHDEDAAAHGLQRGAVGDPVRRTQLERRLAVHAVAAQTPRASLAAIPT